MFHGVFIKFGKKKHLLQLQKEGLIYCNTFEYFRKCEKDEQYDPNENATSISQADDCELVINGYKLSKNGGFKNAILNAPDLNKQQFTHLFCMFCRLPKDKIDSDTEQFFDERLKKFGNYMLVIYNPIEFMNRLNVALDKLTKTEKIIYAESKRVEYINFDTYSGEIEAFRKSDKYQHQSEWRLALQNKDYREPLMFNIKSIEDISILISTKKCKNKVTKNEDGTNKIEI